MFNEFALDFIPDLGDILTAIAPAWNPFWASINEFLSMIFGF